MDVVDILEDRLGGVDKFATEDKVQTLRHGISLR
jgi:hypothetical protein